MDQWKLPSKIDPNMTKLAQMMVKYDNFIIEVCLEVTTARGALDVAWIQNGD